MKIGGNENKGTESEPLLDNGDDVEQSPASELAPGTPACTVGLTFDSKDDIQITMILGSLIYILDEMRQIAKANNLAAKFKVGHEAERQLLVGEYNFIDAQTGKVANVTQPSAVPAHPLNPHDLQKLLEDEDFSKIKEWNTLNNDFTRSNLELLSKLFPRDGEDRKVFINNFNAVHNSTEVVYGIMAMQGNKKAKEANHIAVVFRGSVYGADWMHNLQPWLTEIRIHIEGEMAWLIEGHSFDRIQIKPGLAKALKEALKDEMGDDVPIRVHSGFLKYLFARQDRNEMIKYRVIVNNLRNLMDHPKFKKESELTITGHSLGGALTTLLSFFLACDMLITDDVLKRSRSHIRRYVSCVSYASPLVGDVGFQKAFAFLETEPEGRLKHVRITNGRDFVPLAPPLPWYRHTGVQVHLRGKNWFTDKPQKAVVKYTGVESALWPFIGCMLTTFPPVILFPLYLLCKNIPFLLVLVSFISMIFLTTVKSKNFATNLFVVFMREKALPLGAIAGIVCLIYFYPQAKEVTSRIPTLTLDGWHAYIIGFILLSQVIMFVRQPQHVFDPKCKAVLDEDGKAVEVELGITHSLSHYYHNLQGARRVADLKLSSSKEIWEKYKKRG